MATDTAQQSAARFSRVSNGYDPAEVNTYVAALRDSSQVAQLSATLLERAHTVADWTVARSLQTAEATRTASEAKAASVVQEAEQRAAEIVAAAEDAATARTGAADREVAALEEQLRRLSKLRDEQADELLDVSQALVAAASRVRARTGQEAPAE
ncbi:hypothetical protein [Oryzihumus leptocrescens]|uniref:Uncharacterized protein n=1 Tax=Oryzihumus leptocrescens TaxID=297536 RepID=A0A542ZNW3_9MICO|nr:hypothetical protein [Oryzihumus leptocrescens]TQL61890.1 hypothetical protein FB474_3311 [Oryzihumus leptocrescens]